jgi:hypothetical protein
MFGDVDAGGDRGTAATPTPVVGGVVQETSTIAAMAEPTSTPQPTAVVTAVTTRPEPAPPSTQPNHSAAEPSPTQPEPTATAPAPTATIAEPTPTEPDPEHPVAVLLDDFAPQGKPVAELRRADFSGYYERNGACYTKQSMLLYGQGSGVDLASAAFAADTDGGSITITITGLDDEIDPREPVRVTLNGRTIWEGVLPFANAPQPGDCHGKADWRTVALRLDDAALLQSENELQVQNIAGNGAVGGPPWVLLDSIAIYAE